MWGKINPKDKYYPSICIMAQFAHEPYIFAHDVKANEKATTNFMTASEFVVRLLHREDKPLGENLILKRIRENKVPMKHQNVHSLMVSMLVLGIVTRHGEGHRAFVKYKGYVLTENMKKLIEQNKPQ